MLIYQLELLNEYNITHTVLQELKCKEVMKFCFFSFENHNRCSFGLL